MIIAAYSRIKIDRILHYAVLGSLVAAGLSFIMTILLFLCFSPWQREKEMLTSEQTFSGKTFQGVINYSSIGRGPLMLRTPLFCPFVTKLKEEIIILAKNTRPETTKKETEILVQLKTSNEEEQVLSGSRLYLSEEDEKIHFSSEPTNFWIKPIVSADGHLHLEAEKEGEQGQWVVRVSQDLGKKFGSLLLKSEANDFITTIKNGKFWGMDLLVQQYAGNEHQHLRNKYKLILGNEVCFVSLGDYLIWEEGKWKIAASGYEGIPIAKVKNISPRNIELDVWDVSGFQMFNVKIDLMTAQKTMNGADNIPASIRLRTSTQVACSLGKRRLILKEGDWLVKTAAGWRKLRSPVEIDECLFHKIRGELIIFDKLEKLQGKTVLHAHLFDEMRTQMQTLAIPISAEKKKTAGGKL